MRPTRRAAARAAAAVARPLSPSPISSEEEDLESSGMEEMEVGENEVFSEEEEDDEIDQDVQQLSNNEDMESLSEQEEDEDEDDGNEDEDDGNEDEEMEDEEEEEEEDEEEEEEQMPVIRRAPDASGSKKRKKPVIESDSDEEELIFSDEDTEVLRNKPMTKRQRAKVNQEIPEEYLELPMDTGRKKHLTEEEEQLKRSEVARRRKNQNIQRAEKDKADTINRLLKKQATKSKRIIDDTDDKETPHERLMRMEDPNRLRYTSTSKGSELSIPNIYTVEQIFGTKLLASVQPVPKPRKCQVTGCSKNRKYTAKKSGKDVCSFEHYKIVEAK